MRALRVAVVVGVLLAGPATASIDAYVCKGSSPFWWWVDFFLPGEGWGAWWHDEGTYGQGCHVPVGEGFG